MKTLGLISCTKAKQTYPCSAAKMYSASNLFTKAYQYCIKTYDDTAILSAKYGLLLPDDKIEPYNITLNSMSTLERKIWAEIVYNQMTNRLKLTDYSVVFFHAGRSYRQHLSEILGMLNLETKAPLGNLQIGRQLSWYAKHT